MKSILSQLFVVFSVLGMADAAYISYEKFSGAVPMCGSGFDCGAVLYSSWASIGPVPLSALGFAFYLTVFSLATLHMLDVSFAQLYVRWRRFLRPLLQPRIQQLSPARRASLRSLEPINILVMVTTVGFLFSLYLLFLMAFVIEAWCLYCLFSAATSSALFLTAQAYRWLA